VQGYVSWDVRRKEDGTFVCAVVRSAGDQPWEVWAGKEQDRGKGIALEQLRTTRSSSPALPWQAGTLLLDGQRWLEMDGILITPRGAEQPLPMVVAGSWRARMAGGDADAFAWPQLGQWLLWPATQCSAQSAWGFGRGEQFCRAARGAVGLDDYQDVIGAVDAALERGNCRSERLAIGGWSQGGFMSAWAYTAGASKRPLWAQASAIGA